MKGIRLPWPADILKGYSDMAGPRRGPQRACKREIREQTLLGTPLYVG